MARTLKLYNSLTRRKEDFQPLEAGRLGLYVCAMTVYDYCHIGHARMLVAFDVVQRWLRARGYQVTYVRNITDIDDKIIRRAVENGETLSSLTGRFIAAMHEDEAALGIQRPDLEPRATQYVPQMLDLVGLLEKNGYAYRSGDGDTLFRVRRFAGYGRLGGKSLDDLRAGERVAVAAGKEDPFDFVLWKAAKPEEPAEACWQGPFGAGRPGWHLECSAMSTQLLGRQFDIHGGGADLQFPHHENEIAQSDAAYFPEGGKSFVRYWLHNGFVQVDGEKMSKSLGNVLSIGVLTEEYPAVAVRWALSTVHHRSAIEWGAETLPAAHAAWEKFSTFVARAIEAAGEAPASEIALAPADLPEAFVAAMDDDLNVAGALAVLHEHLKAGNAALASGDVSGVYREQVLVRSMLDVLGLDPASEQWRGQAGIGAGASGAAAAEHSALDALVRAVLEERAAARAAKDWARADELRDRLAAAGVTVADGRDGATWSVS